MPASDPRHDIRAPAPPSSEGPDRLRALVSRLAEEVGFEAVGVVDLARYDPREAADRLAAFLAAGHHGSMEWLADTHERRSAPSALWPQARSAILLGQSYAPDTNPMDGLARRDRGLISVYARGRDYHDVVKAGLKRIARAFAAQTNADVKVFVDTAPLMEKPLAAAAGLGWQGKHTNLVSRRHGSWLFLGAILTTAAIAPDPTETDHCGSCRRCIDICPTDAFPSPYQLDARRCIAYLTIEHKGPIDGAFRKALGNRVFGCDDCLAVCPWNKFAARAREARFAGTDATGEPALADLLAMDDRSFRARFAGTPIKRTGRDRLVRNALIAAGNSGDASLRAPVEALLADGAAIVRGMAVWAFRQLGGGADAARFERMRAVALAHESDGHVRAEWL